MADTEDIEGSSSLASIVADEIRQAQQFDQTKRTLAIEYQRGEMNDLPPRPNGSAQTDRTFADALAWTLPGVVRVFTASDQMVQFESTQEGGEQGAEEASEYTNYSFFRENDGYRILYNATYDSLMLGNGAAASYWCPEEAETKLYRDKTLEEVAVLMEDGWQGLGVPPQVTGTDPETGGPLLTVRLKKVEERGYIRDITLKPENLLINGTATTIEDARFVGYLHDDKTRSDLIDMAEEYGWDKEEIDGLPRNSSQAASQVGIARNAVSSINDNSPVKSGDLIDLYECYVRVDADGDGEAELLQVWYAGSGGTGKVLSSDEWESDVPFTDIPCYPIPHQWQAESLFDRTADIQRVKTTLLRQLLDNSYAVGLPMMEVDVGSVVNPDILVNPKFGGIIWKKAGTTPVQPHVIPFIGDKLMMGLQYMDEMLGKRTGISKTTMALDPEALQNQTATGQQLQHDSAYSQIELIARNMAELGWTKFFAKRRNIAKKYIKEPVKIPSRNGDVPQGQTQGMDSPDGMQPQMGQQMPPQGMQQPGMDMQGAMPQQPAPQPEGAAQASKYRTIQPEAWSDDMACTINVGLGTGSRDRDLAMMSSIQNDQMIMAGLLRDAGFASEAINFIPKIIKTATQKAEAAGVKSPDDYYPTFDIEAMKQQAAQPKPDPALALEQARQQGAQALEQVRGQTQVQIKNVDAQLSQHDAQLKAEGDVAKNQAELQADLQTKGADRTHALELASVQAQLEREKMDKQLAWDTWNAEQNRQLEREKMANAQQIAAMKPTPQPGKGA